MAQDNINNDLNVNGALTCRTFTAPAACIGNTAVAGAAGIAFTKLQQKVQVFKELFEAATAITALNQTLFVADSVGALISFSALIELDTTGADRTVTVDLHKAAAASTSWATVLSATIGFADGETAGTVKLATISSTAFVAGDRFRAVVTVSGSAGNQAKGLTVRLLGYADPQ
jgi:hypothetical protein